MGLEATATPYISDLNVAWPLGGDQSYTIDDHARYIKASIYNSFPGVSGAVTSTHTELNALDGFTGAVGDLNLLSGLVGNTLWHSGNDGDTSGLDADLWKGSTFTVSTSGPSGGSSGDFWFQREV